SAPNFRAASDSDSGGTGVGRRAFVAGRCSFGRTKACSASCRSEFFNSNRRIESRSSLPIEIMRWKVVVRPEAKDDILQAADWYDQQRAGLGDEFVEEVIALFDALTFDPIYQSRPHAKDVRWRHPRRFPYRVVYEILQDERVVIVG